jgi:hypothetical protein
MKVIKSPYFAALINILLFLSTLFCLIFLSVNIAVAFFIASIIVFLLFLILHIFLKSWKYVVINMLILGAFLYSIYRYLDWATERMYQ